MLLGLGPDGVVGRLEGLEQLGELLVDVGWEDGHDCGGVPTVQRRSNLCQGRSKRCGPDPGARDNDRRELGRSGERSEASWMAGMVNGRRRGMEKEEWEQGRKKKTREINIGGVVFARVASRYSVLGGFL